MTKQQLIYDLAMQITSLEIQRDNNKVAYMKNTFIKQLSGEIETLSKDMSIDELLAKINSI